jgi:phage-related minor tail protein
MKQHLLAAILSTGLLLGPAATAQPTTGNRLTVARYRPRHHHRRRGSAARSVGVGALGGAAVGGLVGRGRGALIGGGVGAGAGALHHRSRRRHRRW